MKLLISRDVSDTFSRFTVYDFAQNPLFNVVGKEGSALRRVKVFDSEGRCVLKISATPEIGSKLVYNIVTPDSVFGVTVRLKADELSLKIHGAKLFFKGNLLTRTFEITDVSAKVLAFHKPEAGKSGRYTLEITDEAQTLSLLAVSLCADLLSFADSAAMCRA